jgi:CheY-like chemotaxis protein
MAARDWQMPDREEEPVLFPAQTSMLGSLKEYAAKLRAQPRPSLSVLIVDDEEVVRTFVQRVLREAGYETATAGDGFEAIDAVRRMEPDLLLTDVNMPEMSGDELARQLRQTRPDLKVLYLTGFSDQLFKEKSTLWQGEAYLDKPCSVLALLQAVSLITIGRIGPVAQSPGQQS